MNYWEECISEAAESCGATLTADQVIEIAGWVEGAHENYGMAHGYDAIPNPQTLEVERLERDLKIEKDKIQCPECGGRGSITTHGPIHSGTSECFKCRGGGRVSP